MNVKVYYQNVRGLRTKASEFEHGLLTSNHDIVCLTETWLHSAMSSSENVSSNYAVFWRDRDYANRNCRLYGGVIIAANKRIVAHRSFDLETYGEYVWIEVCSAGGKRCLIGHRSRTRLFLITTLICWRLITASHYIVHIYGDFNFPGLE